MFLLGGNLLPLQSLHVSFLVMYPLRLDRAGGFSIVH
jgi:hypothetical protein